LTARVAFAICLSLFLASAVGCEPGAMVTYVNMTDKRVDVYLGDGARPDDFEVIEVTIEPNSAKEIGTIETVWPDVVVVFDEDGNLVLRREITWDQLKDQDFVFVITEDMLSPTPIEGQ
jgi:hypothetical protein